MTSLLFAGARVFDGSRFLDGPHDLLVADGRVDILRPSGDLEWPGAERHEGGALFPGFVDAHVHLSFSDPAAVAAGGVTTVLDLGEPLASAFDPQPPLTVRASGPLITAPGGYPTGTWGTGGFGLEVASSGEAKEAVALLADRGAWMIKVAIEPRGGRVLEPGTIASVVAAARARGLRVAAHAIDTASVEVAVDAGVDVLAHVPVEMLSDELVARVAGAGVAVVSTARAFGASRAARSNLVALAAAGCRVAYGTDLGNDGISPGLDAEELEILSETIGGEAAALAAATSVASFLAGHGGTIEPGSAADLVWVAEWTGIAGLAGPKRTWIGGTAAVR